MTKAERLMTVVSTKGLVTLPKSIRQRRPWAAGTRLVVEETPEGVLLKAAPVFAATRPEDVFDSLPSGLAQDPRGHGRQHRGRGQAAPCSRLIPI